MEHFFNKPWSFFKICLVASSALIFVVWFSANSLIKLSWRSELPNSINVQRTLLTETDIIFSPGGGCGGAIFKISKKVAQRIELEGIDYFTRKQSNSEEMPTYLWTKMPAQKTYHNLNFTCILRKAAQTKTIDGMHYESLPKSDTPNYLGTANHASTQGKMPILVLPSHRLVVIGYWD